MIDERLKPLLGSFVNASTFETMLESVDPTTTQTLDRFFHNAYQVYVSRTHPGIPDRTFRKYHFTILAGNHHRLTMTHPELPHHILKAVLPSSSGTDLWNGEDFVSLKFWHSTLNAMTINNAIQTLSLSNIMVMSPKLYLTPGNQVVVFVYPKMPTFQKVYLPSLKCLRELLQLVILTGYPSCSRSNVLNIQGKLVLLDTDITPGEHKEGLLYALEKFSRFMTNIFRENPRPMRFEVSIYSEMIKEVEYAKQLVVSLPHDNNVKTLSVLLDQKEEKNPFQHIIKALTLRLQKKSL